MVPPGGIEHPSVAYRATVIIRYTIGAILVLLRGFEPRLLDYKTSVLAADTIGA